MRPLGSVAGDGMESFFLNRRGALYGVRVRHASVRTRMHVLGVNDGERKGFPAKLRHHKM